MKKCSKCKKEQLDSLFSKCNKVKSGLTAVCKECVHRKYLESKKDPIFKEKRRKYREENKDYYKKYNREYTRKNKNKLKIKGKEYRENNKDKLKETKRLYHIKNREKMCQKTLTWQKNNKKRTNEKNRRWRKINKGKVNALTAKRYAAKRQRTPKWADLKAISKFYENCPEGYEVDHIYPLMGDIVSGLHVLNNLQYLKAEENRKKNKKMPEDWEKEKAND